MRQRVLRELRALESEAAPAYSKKLDIRALDLDLPLGAEP
jgi:hypothetical protein